MPVRERASLGVLPRQSDRNPLLEQGGVRERLCVPPIDPAFRKRFVPPLELPCELGIDREPFGYGERSC